MIPLLLIVVACAVAAMAGYNAAMDAPIAGVVSMFISAVAMGWSAIAMSLSASVKRLLKKNIS